MDKQDMATENLKNYKRIAMAIHYIQENFKQQPSLEMVAAEVQLSPYHFQRIFSDWAGVSPKSFLQYTSAQYAMKILKDEQATILDAAYETGLSGSGRLHDLLIKIEGMTPGEYKNGGEDLSINYTYGDSPFGEILIASTTKGVCYIGFVDENNKAGRDKVFNELQLRYPKAVYSQKGDEIQQHAVRFYTQDWNKLSQIKLHLKATDFQLKVWEALLTIPMGKLSTYGTIANEIKNPKASRAVGTAIGQNPVGFLIPCHRVIRANGGTGGYRWGQTRKSAMIGWEAAKTSLAR
jgi:AraC family transcriptional regulator of adaptative response/methylated-DNA-[protein]-cysteine methyltransferase